MIAKQIKKCGILVKTLSVCYTEYRALKRQTIQVEISSRHFSAENLFRAFMRINNNERGFLWEKA